MTEPAAAEAYCPTCNRSFPDGTERCPDDGERLIRFRSDVDPLIGRVLDERFELCARLGRGGMGTVYLAWQRSVEREIAIKLIDPRLASDRTAAKRFLREARLASRLQHPAIVHVLDSGQTDDDLLYIAMELVRGPTLAELIAAGPIATPRAITIAARIAEALAAAHASGIVHRDLKPHNVIVGERDQVKVLDFGLAKSLAGEATTITHDDALMGTPLYMAPEVIAGEGARPASDLYSLGCVLFEMLTGAPPFVAGNANAVLARHLSETAPAVSELLPASVRGLVARLLDKNPARRPSADETRAVLAGATSGIAVADTIATPISTTRRRGRRIAIAIAVAIAVAAAVVVASIAIGGGGASAPATSVPVASPDAAHVVSPPSPDAARARADAAPPVVDAGTIDAARRPHRRHPDASVATPEAPRPPPPHPIDADIEFLPVPSGN